MLQNEERANDPINGDRNSRDKWKPNRALKLGADEEKRKAHQIYLTVTH